MSISMTGPLLSMQLPGMIFFFDQILPEARLSETERNLGHAVHLGNSTTKVMEAGSPWAKSAKSC